MEEFINTWPILDNSRYNILIEKMYPKLNHKQLIKNSKLRAAKKGHRLELSKRVSFKGRAIDKRAWKHVKRIKTKKA